MLTDLGVGEDVLVRASVPVGMRGDGSPQSLTQVEAALAQPRFHDQRTGVTLERNEIVSIERRGKTMKVKVGHILGQGAKALIVMLPEGAPTKLGVIRKMQMMYYFMTKASYTGLSD